MRRRGQCAAQHEHVDTLLADADDNPLRWRLAVRDDLTGVGAADIPSSPTSIWHRVAAIIPAPS